MGDDYLRRYSQFGWDYEIVNPMTDKIGKWYISQARLAKGPVLELASGSGRLLLLLAEAGFKCEGIDLCDAMLLLAQKRIYSAPLEVRDRVILHQMDITEFNLPRKYGLVIIADNSLRDLSTIDAQRACVGKAYRHLEPGGRFLVTLRRMEPEAMSGSRRETGWTKPLRHPETGKLFQRKVLMQLTDEGKRAAGFIFYREVGAESDDDIVACPFEFPVLSTNDYGELFKSAGFSVEVYVGYEERPDDGKEVITNFVCQK